ncbi:oligosaccharide flippase family protein [Bacillus pacificus]|uniref:oligosaccharide flippase family protein n=1 Tax=Bacillus pacificus TaxID=2026187 RepID=UPI003A7FA6A1
MKYLLALFKKNQKIIKGILWIGLGSVISSASVYVSALIIARVLGIEMYGKYAIIQSNVYTFATIASAGLGITVTKFVSQYRNSNKEKCAEVISNLRIISLMTSIMFTVIIIGFSSYYATHILKDSEIIILLRIAAFYVLFTTLNAFQVGALLGFELFKKVARVNLFQGIFNIVITSMFTVLFGITGAIFALTFSSFLLWIYNYVMLKKIYKDKDISLTIVNKFDREITYGFLLPAALCGIVSGIITWGSTNLIVTLKDGYNELAMYNAANNYKTIILYIPNLIGRVVLPTLSNYKSTQKKHRYNSLVKANFAINIAISAFVGAVIVINSKLFFGLYGNDFYDHNILMIVIIIGAILDVTTNLIFQLLVVENKMWSQFLVIVLRYVALLIVTFAFKDTLGGLALGLGYLVSTIVNLLYYIVYYLTRSNRKRGEVNNV